VDTIPTPPSKLAPNVDPRLEAICLKALSKLPAARYAGAREMRADLRGRLVTGAQALADDAPPPPTMRVGPSEKELPAASLSKAPTMLDPAPRDRLAPASASPTGTLVSRGGATEPSAAQLAAKKQRRMIALVAVAVAVVLLLLLAR
jgi:hypothetical protein